VRKTYLLAAVASCIVALGLTPAEATAQQPQAGAPPAYQPAAPRASQAIALLDLNRVFEGHRRFQDQRERLKGEVQQAEQHMQARRTTLRQQADELKQLNAGSVDYKNREAALTEETAKMQAEVQLRRKEFLEKEAKIYHSAYQEVLQLVDWYAKTNGFVAVLRFNGEQADPNDPESILRDINKPVIWHYEGVDITNAILGYLDARAGTSARPQTPAPGAPSSGSIPYQPRR
jgi:Skp family chaperone for outer membrane proteins